MNDFVAKVSSPRVCPIPTEYVKKQLWRTMIDHLETIDLAGHAVKFDERGEFDHRTYCDIYMFRARFIPIREETIMLEHKYDTKYIPNLKLTFWERFKFLFSGRLKERKK